MACVQQYECTYFFFSDTLENIQDKSFMSMTKERKRVSHCAKR